jgi:quinol monooxygenase YgiN
VLIIAGTFEVDPSQRDAFIAENVEGMKTSRAEAGCLDYVMSADPVDPGRVCLFERWESKEHLAPHLERVRTPPPDGAPARIQATSADVSQYEVGAVGPIGS